MVETKNKKSKVEGGVEAKKTVAKKIAKTAEPVKKEVVPAVKTTKVAEKKVVATNEVKAVVTKKVEKKESPAKSAASKKPTSNDMFAKAKAKKAEAAVNKKDKSNQKLNIDAKKSEKHVGSSDKSLNIEQYRSSIRQSAVKKEQLKSLGLGELGDKNNVPNIPTFRKLIDKLKHLVRFGK